jgi:hypothetical protein
MLHLEMREPTLELYMRLPLWSVSFVCLLTAAELPVTTLAASENLFFIKRSKNTNEVHYDARFENCAWSRPEVDSYWRDLQDGPNAVSEIKWYERPAYGFEISRVSDSEITIRINALPEKKITVRLSPTDDGDCRVSSAIEIDGKTARLRSIYVNAEETKFLGLVPTGATVHYIDILGYSEDGRPVFERITKTVQREKLDPLPPDASRWQSGAEVMGRP